MSRKRYVILVAVLSVSLGCQRPPNIDQLGGTRLVYKIKKPAKPIDREMVTSKLRQRLDPSGKTGIQVALDDESLEIEVPNVEGVDLNKVKSLVTAKATLELMILAKRSDAELSKAIETAEAVGHGSTIEVDGKVLGRWLPIAGDTDQAVQFNEDNFSREVDGKKEVLLRVSDLDISSQHFANAAKSFDERKRPGIDFVLTAEGATRMAQLTTMNSQRRLAVVFGKRVVSAPTIMSPIQGRGQITGHFTEEEVDNLVSTLAAGPLPFEFESDSPQVIKVEPKK